MSPYIVLLAIASGGDPGPRLLTKCQVKVDDSLLPVSPVYDTPDAILLPAVPLIREASHGLCSVTRSGDTETDIVIGGQPVIRVMDSEKDTTATFLLADGKRTESIPSAFDEEGGHLIMDPRLLGWLFGDSVKVSGTTVTIRTPAYWAEQIGIDRARARSQSRFTATLKYLPDFGISPAAKRIALWVRPERQVYCQIYTNSADTPQPEPLLGVRNEVHRVGLGPGDRPVQWNLRANHTTLAVEEFTSSSVGLEAPYIVLLTDRSIGDGDPLPAIAGSTSVADGEWAVYGVSQTVAPTPVVYDFEPVRKGDSIDSVAKRMKVQPSVLMALNGLQEDDTLDPGSSLVVTKEETNPLPEAPRDYLDDGLYCVRAGDTIASLATAWNVTVDEVVDANPDLVDGATLQDQELLTKIRPRNAPLSKHPLKPLRERLFRTQGSISLTADIQPNSSVRMTIPAGVFITVEGAVVGTDYYLATYFGVRGYVYADPRKLRQLSVARPAPIPDSNYVAVSSVSGQNIGNPIVREAVAHLGLRYDWGGNSLKSGIDCSHFVAKVLHRAGDFVPDAPVANQENYGTVVEFKSAGMLARRNRHTVRLDSTAFPQASSDLNNLKVGDRFIVQYKLNESEGSRHTGIYLGQIRWRGHNYPHAVIHASTHPGVTISEIDHSFIWNHYKYSVRGANR